MDPATLKYAKTHEWIGAQDGAYVIGITAHAAELLGDVTYVELPAVGTVAVAGGTVASVESVKAASDVYAPVAGRVIEVNEALNDAPELVNQSPYDEGWFLKLADVDPAALDALMDAAAYETFAAEDK